MKQVLEMTLAAPELSKEAVRSSYLLLAVPNLSHPSRLHPRSSSHLGHNEVVSNVPTTPVQVFEIALMETGQLCLPVRI